MAEVTTEDINRIYDKIDTVHAEVQTTRESVIRVETKLASYTRPCETLLTHLDSHKETSRLWKRPVVSTFIDLIKMAVVAVITYIFVSKHKGS